MEVDFCCEKLKMLNDFQAVRSNILYQIWRKNKAIMLPCCPQIPVGDWSPKLFDKGHRR